MSLMKQWDHALKTAIKSGLAHHRRTFQQLRNKVVNELREGKAKFFIDIINDYKGHSKQTWENIIRALKKTKNRDKEFE